MVPSTRADPEWDAGADPEWDAGIFFINVSQKLILNRNTIRVSNRLDLDQVRHFVGPDLDPICLLNLSSDDNRRQMTNMKTYKQKLNTYLLLCTSEVFEKATNIPFIPQVIF